jgi:hypothetical protein
MLFESYCLDYMDIRLILIMLRYVLNNTTNDINSIDIFFIHFILNEILCTIIIENYFLLNLFII